jgi:LPXTG-site transpeptidase (sortase) family protein
MSKNVQLSENDLVRIFAAQKHSKENHPWIFVFMKRFLIFSLSVILVYVAINFPAFKDKIFFWYKSDIQTNAPLVSVPDIGTLPSDDLATSKEYNPDMEDNHILIPSLGISAPISWRIANNSSAVSLGLQNGIIQVEGTALPGENGNVYVTGHSSNYIWAKGKYNSIFAIIDKLVVGDVVYLKYGNVAYTYKIKDQRVVNADDLSVLEQGTGSHLSLVTCWPVGTSLRRLVVLADQVSPDPTKNKPVQNTKAFTTLPSGR